jgi:hypothetical protein
MSISHCNIAHTDLLIAWCARSDTTMLQEIMFPSLQMNCDPIVM